MLKIPSLGGQEVSEKSGGEKITVLDPNKTMVLTNLTTEAPVRPEPVSGLQNINAVFDHYKPKVEVEFTDKEGVPVNNTLNFRSVGDFGKKGVIEKSDFLQSLEAQRVEYLKFVKMLKIKQLTNVLNNPEAKRAYLGVLKALINELEDTKI